MGYLIVNFILHSSLEGEIDDGCATAETAILQLDGSRIWPMSAIIRISPGRDGNCGVDRHPGPTQHPGPLAGREAWCQEAVVDLSRHRKALEDPGEDVGLEAGCVQEVGLEELARSIRLRPGLPRQDPVRALGEAHQHVLAWLGQHPDVDPGCHGGAVCGRIGIRVARWRWLLRR